MKELRSAVNDSISKKTIKYRVQLAPVTNQDGMSVDVTISVDADDKKEFEKWLLENEGTIFSHAAGGNIEY